jgi:hypothetical protein
MSDGITSMPPPKSQKTLSELRARTEATFKARHQQQIQAPIARREYLEAEQAIRDRTAKLREERLKRDAATKQQV